MSLVNHKSLIFSFNRKKPGKNSKRRVHVCAYTLVQTVQCLQFTINRFHSKALHEVLNAWLLLCFELQVNKSTDQLQRTTLCNPDSQLTSLFFTLLLRCICQHFGSALLGIELLWHSSHGFLIIRDHAMWSLPRNWKQRNESNFWP